MTPDNGRLDLIARCAGLLSAAESARRPIDPLTTSYPQLNVADAYRIQQANIELRMTGGQRIVGHKIGLTAKAMQDLFDVSEPDFGHLMDTMMRESITSRQTRTPIVAASTSSMLTPGPSR